MFLINAVKFHCGQLFHLFDETLFMQGFASFYDPEKNRRDTPTLWYIHFLIILALGKALTVRSKADAGVLPGGELFVQAMQLLPDVSFLCRDCLHSVEVLCCASLYLQCLDHRSAAYNLVRCLPSPSTLTIFMLRGCLSSHKSYWLLRMVNTMG